MPIFDASFEIPAPLEAVAAFHRDPAALRLLTPPPMRVQFHHIEPLAENSRAEFTLWLGPIPLHWLAVHTQVDALHGFTDTQQRGPLAVWRHTHHFSAAGPNRTRQDEHIEYQYPAGWRGWLLRLFFAPPMLRVLFAYRRWATTRALRRSSR